MVTSILRKIPLSHLDWVHANDKFKNVPPIPSLPTGFSNVSIQMCIAGVENFLKMSKDSSEEFKRNSLRIIMDAYEKEGIPLSINGAACNIWFLTLAGPTPPTHFPPFNLCVSGSLMIRDGDGFDKCLFYSLGDYFSG